jgi:hypothetical protein
MAASDGAEINIVNENARRRCSMRDVSRDRVARVPETLKPRIRAGNNYYGENNVRYEKSKG